MDGELAVLYQGGEQIGGLLDWEIDFSFQSGVRNGWYEHKPIKHISAKGYWLNLAPDNSYFEVIFYKIIRGQLIFVDADKVEIEFRNKSLDKKLYFPTDIRRVE